MGLRSLEIFKLSSDAVIDLRRQNLTSTDVRHCRFKSIPALKRLMDVFDLLKDLTSGQGSDEACAE